MKVIKRIRNYFSYKWNWIEVVFSSPFVGLKTKWYFGKVAVGIPYFLPKKWFQFNYVSLGWKTKYDDFRHEWDPLFSLVLFNRQIAVWFVPNADCCSSIYWEAWLNYKYKTNKNHTQEERVKELILTHSATWSSITEGRKESINYYGRILKYKYARLIFCQSCFVNLTRKKHEKISID